MFHFITKQGKDSILRFRDVFENQFFVDDEGRLCQKICSDEYCIIASKDGTPCCYVSCETPTDTIVKKIFPEVTKIEF